MFCRQKSPLVLGIGMVLGLLVGCQMLARGPSDGEQIRALTNKFVEAGNNQDLESLMSCLAEDFEGENGEDKEAIGGVFEYILATGAGLDAADFAVDIAEDANTAEVKNVIVMDTAYVLLIKKEEATWLIAGYRQP
jgi:ketosteroid isomerase-like protein